MRGELLLLLADGLVILCLARYVLQWAALDSRHTIVGFYTQMTDWFILPLRKIIPPFKKWDMACVFAGLMLYYIVFTIITFISLPNGISSKLIAANLLFAIIHLLKAASYTLLLGLLLRMVLSLNQPYSPFLAVLHKIFIPLSKPFSFLRVGNYDFSGSVIAIMLWFWLSHIIPQLMSQLNLWLLQ